MKSFIVSLSLVFSLFGCSTTNGVKQFGIEHKWAELVVPFKTLETGRIYGTGFHIKYKGKYYIMSNRHVCNAFDLPLRVQNNIVKKLYVSEEWDICVTESHRNVGFEISDEDLNLLQPITTIGYPLGYGKSIEKGRLILLETMTCIWYGPGKERCQISLLTSAQIYPGNSGSPVLNNDGKVVGVMYAGSNRHKFSSAVPLYAIKQVLSELK